MEPRDPNDPIPATVDPTEALQRAIASLREGRHDSRHVEGAQANALESIAWSLVGLLSAEIRAGPAKESAASLSAELRERGFFPLEAHR